MTTDVSEFLEKKWRQFFRFMDVNKDGKITEEDQEQLVRNLTKVGTALTEEEKQIMTYACRRWIHSLQPDRSVIVDEERYVEGMKESYKDIAEFKRLYINSARTMFHSVDSNRNGVLSIAEFEAFYKAFGKENTEYMHEVFSKVDTDGDGYIQKQEFIDDVVRFFMDQDPTTGQAFVFSVPAEVMTGKRKGISQQKL